MPNNNNPKKTNLDSSYFISNFYAKLEIKGIELLPQNVILINIRESVFDLIPVLEMSILDNGLLSEKYPLEDNDEILIELSTSDTSEPVIVMKFSLQDFRIFNTDGDNLQLVNIVLTGVMKNKDLFLPLKTRAFSNKNSVDVISSIASECGFNPKPKIKTSDNMTWRQLQQNNYQMIFETMKRGFKVDDALMGCITRKGDFIITSLKTELKNKTTKKAVYDPRKAIESGSKESETEFHFNNFNLMNSSGTVNKKIGYGLEYSYWDLDEFKIKTIKSDYHGLTQFSFKNKENIGKIVRVNPSGILNDLNVHRNYFEAIAQNEFYMSDFFKNPLIIYTSPSNAINIFDKLDLIFPSFEDGDAINSTLSGEYMVGSIAYQVSKDGIFRSCIGLFRNGINGSPAMKKSQYKVS